MTKAKATHSTGAAGARVRRPSAHPRPSMARGLPSEEPKAAPGGRKGSERDTPMPASAARRLVLDEAPSPELDAAPADDDWNIPAIATRAASAPDEVRVLTGLYHCARITAHGVAAASDNVQMEARRIFPEPPAEIRDPAKSGFEAALLPQQDWPQWRREIYDRWALQCSLIEKGLGVDVADEASRTADRLMDELATRALAIPAKSVKDVLEKIGVMGWQIDAEVLDGDEAGKLLRIIEADLKRLDERG